MDYNEWKQLADKARDIKVTGGRIIDGMTGRGPNYKAPPEDVAKLDAKLTVEAIKSGQKYLDKIKEAKETLKKRYKKCQPNDPKISHRSDVEYFPAFPYVLDLSKYSLIIVGGGKYVEVTISRGEYSVRTQSKFCIDFWDANLNKTIKFIDEYMYGKTW